MKHEQRTQSTPTATALTQSNLTPALDEHSDATAAVPSTSSRASRRYESGIIAASGRIKRIDPSTNMTISLGERVLESGPELRVYHRIDENVAQPEHFTAAHGESDNRYRKAGQFAAQRMRAAGAKSYTLVSDVPIATPGEPEYRLPAQTDIERFRTSLDDALRNYRA